MFGKARTLAVAVEQLRTVQKSNGVGYKSSAAAIQAMAIEKQVDAIVAEILKWPPIAPDPADGD